MKIAVMQFPGTNCEFETLVAVKEVGMEGEIFRWNRPEEELSGFDGFIIPGGFSYQDRVRAGAVASKEPVLKALKEEAALGKPILGICNGFQILVEAGLLPGLVPGTGKVQMALAQNVMVSKGEIVRRGYYCDWVYLRHDASSRRCSGSYQIEMGALLKIPIAHGDKPGPTGQLFDPSLEFTEGFLRPVNLGSTESIAKKDSLILSGRLGFSPR